MLFAIDQQQYLQGYLPIAFLSLYKKYGLMPAGTVMTGPGFVTQENAAQVIELSQKGIR
jgi:simple sugar transport system substrate-binding protein